MLHQLEPRVQNYAWGERGFDSLVYRYYKSTVNSELDPSIPCAELWVGSHPSLDNYVFANGTKAELSKAFPNFKFPVLFKILSIREPLSLQLHPDAEGGKKLHATNPDVYKDPHPKPEMCISLSDDFEAFNGFRPVDKIRKIAEVLPSFKTLAGQQTMESQDEASFLKNLLAKVVGSVMPEDIENICKELEQAKNELPQEYELMDRLRKHYPRDIGVIAPLYLQHHNLKTGQSFFIDANRIHAYIKGHCMECMVTSDNVIRAGLTPKFIDIPNLLALADYSASAPDFVLPDIVRDIHYVPSAKGSVMVRFKPKKFPFLQVLVLILNAGVSAEEIPLQKLCIPPVMCFCLAGEGEIISAKAHTQTLAPGHVLMLENEEAMQEFSVKNTGHCQGKETDQTQQLSLSNASSLISMANHLPLQVIFASPSLII